MSAPHDELTAAKKLIDQGILIQEEFDAKKAQLLADETTAAAPSTAPARRQKSKTAPIVGTIAVVAVITIGAIAAALLLSPDSREEALVGEWSGTSISYEGEILELSRNTVLTVKADHTLTLSGGGIDMSRGTWSFNRDKSDDDSLVADVTLEKGSFEMRVTEMDHIAILNLYIDSDPDDRFTFMRPLEK